MGIMDKVLDFATGGILGTIKDVAMSYFPPDMSPTDKAKAELAMAQVINERERDLERAITDAQASFDNRIKEMEGTASDLKTIPWVGPFIIFLRGVQRPIWGFAVLYFDNLWLFSTTAAKFSERQEQALIIINILVLGFLFGERTLKNLEPLLTKLFAKAK